MGVQLGSAYGEVQIGYDGKGIGQALAGLGGLTTTMQAVGGMVKSAVVDPLIGVGRAAVEMAGDFQSQMAVLGIAARSAGESMGTLHEAAMAVGGDTSLLGVSASGAAESMTGLYKAGLSSTEIFGNLNGYLAGTAELGGAMRASIDLAAASELDMVQAADLASVALATFGGQAAESGQSVDQWIVGAMGNLVQAADASVAEVGGLRDALVSVGPTASAMGMSLEDTNNALAILSTRGIQGSEAGTALKSMLTNLQRQTPAVTSTLEELGITLYDASGVMRPLPEIIGQFETALAGATQEQKNQIVQTLAGTYGMNAMNTLLSEGTAGWDEMADATANAATMGEQAAAKSQTMQGAMESLEGVVETLAIGFGEGLLPAITDVISTGTGILEQFVPAVRNMAAGVGAILSQMFQLFKSVVGGIARALGVDFGQLSGNAGAWGQNFVVSLAKGMASAIGAIVQVLNKIGAIISGFLRPGSPPKLLPDLDKWGAAAATVYMEGWGEADFDIFDQLSGTIEGYLKSLSEEAVPKDMLIPWMNTFQAAIAEGVNGIGEIGSASRGAFDEVMDAAEFLPEAMKAYAQSLMDVQIAQNALSEVMGLFDQVAEASVAELRALAETGSGLPEVFQQYAASLLAVDAAAQAVNEAQATLKEIAGATFQELWNMTKATSDLDQVFKEYALSLVGVARAEEDLADVQAMFKDISRMTADELRDLVGTLDDLPVGFREYAASLVAVEDAADALSEAQRMMTDISRATASELQYMLAAADGATGVFRDYVESLAAVERAGRALSRAMDELKSRSEDVRQAQSALNAVTDQYAAILGPMNAEMKAIRDRKQDIKDEQRLAEIRKKLAQEGMNATERELLQLEMREIQLQKQIRTTEDEKDVAVDAAQAKLDAAKEAEAAAKLAVSAAKEELAATKERAAVAKNAAKDEIDARREALAAAKEQAVVAKRSAEDEITAREEVLAAAEAQATAAKKAAQEEVAARKDALSAIQEQARVAEEAAEAEVAAARETLAAAKEQVALKERLIQAQTDANNTLKDQSGIMEGLESTMAGLGESVAAGVGEATGALGDAITTDIGLLQEGLEGSLDLGAAVAPADETLSSVQQIVADIEGAFAPLGEAADQLGTTWGGVFGGLGEQVDKVRPLFEQVWGFLQTNMVPVLAGLGAVIMTAVAPALATFVSGIVAVLAPALLVGAAVGLLVSAWQNNWGGIRDTLTTVWHETILPLLGQFQILLGQLAAWWELHGPGIREAAANLFAKFVEVLSDLAERVVPWVQEKIALLGAWFTTNGPLIENAIRLVGEIFGFLAERVGAMWLFVQPILDLLITVILGIAQTLLQVAAGDWAGAWETIKTTAGQAWVFLQEGLAQLFDWIVGWFGLTGDQVLAVWQEWWTKLKELVSGVVEGIVGFFTDLYDRLVGHSIIPDLINAILGAWEWLRDEWHLLVEELVAWLLKAWEEWKTKFEELIDALVLWWTETWADWKTKFEELIDAVVLWWTKTWEDWKTAFEKLIDDVVGAVLEAWWDFKNKLKEIIQGVIDWFVKKWEDFKGVLSGTAREIVSSLLGIFKGGDWHGVGASMSEGIRNGIKSKIESIKSKAKEAVKRAIAAAKAAAGAASPSKVADKEVGQPIGEGVGVGIVAAMADVERQFAAAVGGVLAAGMPRAAVSAMAGVPAAPVRARREVGPAAVAGPKVTIYGGLTLEGVQSPQDLLEQLERLR